MHGGDWYRDLGVNGAKGMRFFSISGDVNRPGVYEVPCGMTLRELIDDHAGGLARRPGAQGVRRRRVRRAASCPRGCPGPAPEGFAARLAERERTRQEAGRRPERRRLRHPRPGARPPDDARHGPDARRRAGRLRRARRHGRPGRSTPPSSSATSRAASASPAGSARRSWSSWPAASGQWQYDEESLRPVEELLTDLQRTMEMTSICGLGHGRRRTP